ncbi:hypothetical protein PCASD_20563 [Puccinia coronata f. sp. avenae]|uniref:Uncharacterized protein n=1 Tax=Puccinia coronata f. sp. avenae TaxID=200324 RepID=A0A2N5SRJ2_9BASI|nr:hypothetical protein PCASD_23688 [Puccinia coronata f. sp. avenae]PLW33885.1 hypothetical protein PCASD_20563 [Puccinia coronata f. sp. avenae]
MPAITTLGCSSAEAWLLTRSASRELNSHTLFPSESSPNLPGTLEDKFVLSIHANRFPAVLIQGEETVHHGSCVALVGELKSNAKG